VSLPDYPATLPSMLHQIADTHGDLEAIVRGPHRITYRELERESGQLARGLLAAGAGKGTRVALLMSNSPDWVIAFMAAARIGAIVVPLSTLLQAPELRWVLRHADVDTLFVQDRYLRHDYVTRLVDALPSLADQKGKRLFLPEAPYLRSIHVWGGSVSPEWAHASPDALRALADNTPAIDDDFLARVEAEVTPSDLLLTIYTSGSTADPKGVAHYHGSVVRHSYQMSRDFTLLAAGDRMATQRPWFWVAGLVATLLYGLHAGACLIIPETDDPVEALRLIEQERLTFVGGGEPWFAAIAAHPAVQASEFTVRQLSLDIAGVARRAPASADDARFVREGLEARIPARDTPLPKQRIPNMFGMTEMLGAHSAEPCPTVLPEHQAGGSGRAVPGVIHRIVDPATGEEQRVGQLGELQVRGYSLMAGLHKREREETFEPDGFYRTGDLCFVDASGCLTFKSRLGDMLKVHGANVSPLEVERCLNAQPGVFDSAVLGLPDGSGDTLVVAGVVPLEGAKLSEAELIARLREELSSFKVPRRMVFLAPDEVPRTGSGKVQKFKLKDILRTALASRNGDAGDAGRESDLS
jgi:acyl-CoA synthetase (AMP-forming)/AMP-acid ligase II